MARMTFVAYLRDAWARRELLRQLAWREVKAGRRQSLLGLGWIFLQPLAYLFIISLVFAVQIGRGEQDVPYPLVLVCGLIPWLFFAGTLSAGTTSVVGMGGLIGKVAFPRVFCPLSAMAAHLPNLLAGLVILCGMLFWYGRTPTVHWLWLVPIFLVLAVLALGLALFLGAFNVYTRDVESLLPLLMQVWFFASPIIYPLGMGYEALARHGLLALYKLNPMIYLIEALRSALLYGRAPGDGLAIAAGLSLLVLGGGWLVFTRLERNFADVV